MRWKRFYIFFSLRNAHSHSHMEKVHHVFLSLKFKMKSYSHQKKSPGQKQKEKVNYRKKRKKWNTHKRNECGFSSVCCGRTYLFRCVHAPVLYNITSRGCFSVFIYIDIITFWQACLNKSLLAFRKKNIRCFLRVSVAPHSIQTLRVYIYGKLLPGDRVTIERICIIFAFRMLFFPPLAYPQWINANAKRKEKYGFAMAYTARLLADR